MHKKPHMIALKANCQSISSDGKTDKSLQMQPFHTAVETAV